MIDVPFEFRIWSVADCAEYLRYAPRYFRDKVRYQEGFPEPLPGLELRWRAADVVAWALRNPTPESRQPAISA